MLEKHIFVERAESKTKTKPNKPRLRVNLKA